ncbi:syncytin-1-like [Rhinolophus ferrumequinum]|uniref:syncytin-1-like n=1 Tax=Rhinolophus ferrumequinum TaxID=59479 RepID=UPI00140F8512|nr:syncytin-1-like [Rhinolophus ferrumequinum]
MGFSSAHAHLPVALWLLSLLCLSPLSLSSKCPCFRGSGTRAYFQFYTLMPQECYRGTTPTTCTESGRTYWTATLTQTFQSPCNSFPRGPVCWTYLAQAGSSDGGGVQDTALRNIAATRIVAIAQATPPHPHYRGLNLTSLRRATLPDTQDLTRQLNTSIISGPIGDP